MRRFFVPVLLVLLTVALVAEVTVAQKKEPIVPGEVVQAQYVYVTSSNGNLMTATPEDREAVANVENALRKWGKYRLTINPRDADLVFMVRSGRIAAASGGPIIHLGNGKDKTVNTGVGETVRGDVGPTDDVLEVYRGGGSRNETWLWRGMERNGLLNDMSLIRKFRQKVEETEKAIQKK